MNVKTGIRASYLAHGLSDEYVDVLCSIAHEEAFDDLAEIVRQEDLGRDLYVVLEGRVLVQSVGGHFIGRLKPGGLLGEVALIDARPRSASVSADGAVRVAVVPAAALLALMEERSDMGMQILRNLGRVLCERLRSANLQVEVMMVAF